MKETYLLYLLVATISFGLVIFFVSAKNRIPLVPALTIFAAAGLYEFFKLLKAKRYLLSVLYFFCAVLIYFFMNVDAFLPKKIEVSKPGFPANYYLGKAIVYLEKSENLKAIEVLKKAENVEPQNPYILFSLGTVYYKLKATTVAEEYFKKAIKLSPFYVEAYYNLGLIYNEQKRFSQAEEVLKKAVFFDPDNAPAHFELGEVYKARGLKIEAAIEFYKALSKINRWRKKDIGLIREELRIIGENALR